MATTETLDQQLRQVGKEKATAAFEAAIRQLEKTFPKYYDTEDFKDLMYVEDVGIEKARQTSIRWREIRQELREVMLPKTIEECGQREVEQFLKDHQRLRDQVNALEERAQP